MANVIEFAYCGSVVQLESVGWHVEVGMKMLLYFGRDFLDLGIIEFGVGNDGIDESALGELERSIAKAFDGDANVVGRVALVLNVETNVE